MRNNASKVAGMQMMRHLAREQPGFIVISVHPGVVNSAMNSPSPVLEAMIAAMRKKQDG